MAKKSSGPNKSQAIRDYYSANPGAKPKEIVDALAGQGITVTPAFVSTIKSNMVNKPGTVSRRAGRPAKSPVTRRGPRGPRGPRAVVVAGGAGSGGGKVSIDNLIKAKSLAKEMGGIDNALSTLAALKQLAD